MCFAAAILIWAVTPVTKLRRGVGTRPLLVLCVLLLRFEYAIPTYFYVMQYPNGDKKGAPILIRLGAPPIKLHSAFIQGGGGT